MRCHYPKRASSLKLIKSSFDSNKLSTNESSENWFDVWQNPGGLRRLGAALTKLQYLQRRFSLQPRKFLWKDNCSVSQDVVKLRVFHQPLNNFCLEKGWE